MAYVLSGPPAVEELLRQRPYPQVDLATTASVGVGSLAGGAAVEGEAGEPSGGDVDGDDGDEAAETVGEEGGRVPGWSGGAIPGGPDSANRGEVPVPGSEEWLTVEHTEGEDGRDGDWVGEHREELVAQGRWSVLEEEW
jgi:hypothetical protein